MTRLEHQYTVDRMRLSDSLALVASLQFGISGPLDCHVYAIPTPQGAVLIDAGSGTATEQLLSNLRQDLGSDAIAAVLLTHSHVDHCGGAADIRDRTHCQVFAPQLSREILETGDEEASGLRVAREQEIYPPGFRLLPCPVDRALVDREQFSIAGLQFTAIHVRGHSRDTHCYLTQVDGLRWLFTGDVLFYGGVLGVINAEGSGMEGYRSDIRKLAMLGVDCLFPGHGLFTFCGGQRHLDAAIEQVGRGFLGRQIGQGDLIF